WTSTNYSAPGWAHEMEVVAFQPPAFHYNPLEHVQDSGDPAYDWTSAQEQTWSQSFGASVSPLVVPDSNDIHIIHPPSAYQGLQDQVGFTGAYDGFVGGNGNPSASILLRDNLSEVRGDLTLQDSNLTFHDPICGDLTMPATTLPLHLTSTGPVFPGPL